LSEKNLTESEWKKFNKSRKLEDKEFLKTIAALESGARAKDAGAQLKAFDEFERQAAKLRAIHKADKELARYLDDAAKALLPLRRQLQLDLKKTAVAAESQDEEEQDGPAVLTTKMLPLLRQVPKGEVALPAMVAAVGKSVAVLVARKTIGASQKKLLVEALGVSAGVKYMPATCIWEANAHTFVLEAKVANLAKLVKAALLLQTGVKFKVRVRGMDPNDVDEDGDADDVQAQDQSGEATSADDSGQATYQRRLAELKPGVAAALRAQQGDLAKIKGLLAFAEGKAAQAQYKPALQALDSLAPLLGAAGQPAGGAAAEQSAAQLSAALTKLAPLIQQAATAQPARRQALAGAVAAVQAQLKGQDLAAAQAALAQLAQLLQGQPAAATGAAKPAKVPTVALMPIWEAATESVMEQTTALIVGMRRFGDAEMNRMADDLRKTVNDLLGEVDESLQDYDDMSAEERAAHADEALSFLRAQRSAIGGERLIQAADTNPLGIKTQLAATMERAIEDIAAAFQA
jgi:hypothetical protein